MQCTQRLTVTRMTGSTLTVQNCVDTAEKVSAEFGHLGSTYRLVYTPYIGNSESCECCAQLYASYSFKTSWKVNNAS